MKMSTAQVSGAASCDTEFNSTRGYVYHRHNLGPYLSQRNFILD